jgi:hypothetical protein
VRSAILVAVTMEITAFWDVMQYGLVDVTTVLEECTTCIFTVQECLKMKVIGPSKISKYLPDCTTSHPKR